MKKLELKTANFIKRATSKYGDKFNYSKVNYVSSKTKVSIICPLHGEFEQTPDGHMRAGGCLVCVQLKRSASITLFAKNKKSLPENLILPDKVKAIPLTQGKYALVDEEDYERVNKYNWGITKTKYRNIFYAKNFHVKMHRFIMGVTDPQVHIDHINHDGLDNRKVNLRACSSLENSFNSRSRENTSSKYKGVEFIKKSGKWKANICKQQIEYPLGHYKTEEEAARAYDVKAKELFGDFANLNFKNN